MGTFLCDVHASENEEQVRAEINIALGVNAKIKLSGTVPERAGAILASLRAWTAQKIVVGRQI